MNRHTGSFIITKSHCADRCHIRMNCYISMGIDIHRISVIRTILRTDAGLRRINIHIAYIRDIHIATDCLNRIIICLEHFIGRTDINCIHIRYIDRCAAPYIQTNNLVRIISCRFHIERAQIGNGHFMIAICINNAMFGR